MMSGYMLQSTDPLPGPWGSDIVEKKLPQQEEEDMKPEVRKYPSWWSSFCNSTEFVRIYGKKSGKCWWKKKEVAGIMHMMFSTLL